MAEVDVPHLRVSSQWKQLMGYHHGFYRLDLFGRMYLDAYGFYDYYLDLTGGVTYLDLSG